MKVVVIKDYKENEKKCSVLPLRGRKDFEFISRDNFDMSDFSGLTLLHPEGEPVKKLSKDTDLLLVDSNWRKARKMYTRLEQKYPNMKKVSISGFVSGYPWKKGRPENGLCSIEVLFAAFLLAGIYDESLFDSYRYKDKFFELNKEVIAKLKR
ncbi:MAG: hypothetical protein V1839_03600 [archaeon]